MRQTILLADDSPTIQRLVLQTFVDTPFDIVSVSNGDSAIRKFEEIRPSAVLADIYMPGKNGFEVCAYVKAHESMSDTPVILLVGAFDAFDEGTSTRAGAAAHITKPFEPRALVELVLNVLARKDQSGDDPEPDSPAREVPEESAPAPEAGVETVQKSDDSDDSAAAPVADSGDLMGLELLFPLPNAAPSGSVHGELADEEIDRIADRVIQKMSAHIVESVAWDVVPDIASKVLRDELKRTTHEG